MPTQQYFALDSLATGYAAAIADLASKTSTNRGYTVTQVVRSASHDSDIKIICAYVDEADLTGDTAGLAAASYPTELCRHRWTTLPGFRMSGFHMLGESVRSWEGAASRVAVHIRPQTGPTSGNPGLPTGGGYGDGNGLTDYDAGNGPQDNVALGGGATHLYETGKSYFYKEGAHIRWGHMGAGGNSPSGNGGAGQGILAVEDATGLGAAGKVNFYYGGDSSPLGPGMFWGTFTLLQNYAVLPFEEFGSGSGIFVNGQGNTASGSQNIGRESLILDAKVEDVTVDEDTLRKRHFLKGHTTLANLDGTGGRGRYYAQAAYGIGEAAWDAVLFNDGSNNWTDLTTAANDATADDFEIMPAGAANGAYIAFIRTAEFPGSMFLNMSQAQVGGTIVPGYSLGSGDVTGTFTNIIDPSSGLTVNMNGEIAFNPKADWASDTFAAGESFETTGYAFVFRKTGGTVTQAARGDQTLRRARAVFMHRWNDEAPDARGFCLYEAFKNGLRHDLNGKANYEYVNARMAATGFWPQMNGCGGVILSGSQLVPYGDLQLGSSNMAPAFQASQAAKGQKVWWAITDMRVQDKTNPLIQDILAEVQNLADLYGVDGDVTADMDALGVNPADYLTAADDLPEWSDIVGCINGPYPGVGGGRWNPLGIDGLRIRKVGMFLDLMNDAAAIDCYVNENPTDHHSFAMRGDQDADAFSIERLGFEDFLRAVETYAPATGNDDAPVSGSSSGCKNWRFRFGYHHTHNGSVDSGQPTAGFVFSGDNDRGKYDDGTGGDEGNEVLFWGFKGINNETDVSGSGIANSAEEPVIARGCVFDGCRWAVSLGRSAGPFSTNVIRAEAGGDTEDITQWLKDSGGDFLAVHTYNGSAYTNVTTAANNSTSGDVTAIPISAPVNSALVLVAREPFRRFSVNKDQSRVGGAGVWEYSQGGDTWAAATVTDSTSGFSSGSNDSVINLTLTLPGDWASDTINSTTGYALRWRVTTATVTTAAILNRLQVHTREPLFPTGATGEAFYLGIVNSFVRRFGFATVVAGVGGPTLAWEYRKNDDSWAAVSSLTDNTSGFTVASYQSVSFSWPTDAATIEVGGKTCWFVRCRIASGSFSTVPRVDEIDARSVGASIDIQHYTVKNYVKGVLRNVTNDFTNNSAVIIDDHGTIVLNEGDDSDTPIYRIASTDADNPSEALGAYQARTKDMINTAAEADSVFGPNHVFEEPA